MVACSNIIMSSSLKLSRCVRGCSTSVMQGPKGKGSMETRLQAMEQEVFRYKGMVECGLNANHLMIADYTRDLKVDGKSMKDIIFTLNEQINFL